MYSVEKFLKDVKPLRDKIEVDPVKPPLSRIPKKKFFKVAGMVFATGVALMLVGIVFVFFYFGQGLPDINQLQNYEPPVVTRIHANDGSLMTEYATQKRLFVPSNAIPPDLIDAFIAAEDQNFHDHIGVDIWGIFRAAVTNMGNTFSNRRMVGGSTITQQVAKNFLLTNEVSLDRKIKEAILALRIERAYDKQEILELYMNEIYLGFGSYGVAAAALNYFNKSLDELTLGEMAYLAALPKGPNNYHPVRRYEAAVVRRNWVLGRMLDEDFITREQYREERRKPLDIHLRLENELFRADYFEEEVRRELLAIYGESKLYGGGMSVHTTLEPRLQAIAEKVLRDGLVAYDRRHGWKGPLDTIELVLGSDWADRLGEMDISLGIDSWRLAVVVGFEREGAVIGFQDGSYGFIPLDEAKWARRWTTGERLGRKVTEITQVLERGDVIPVEKVAGPENNFALRQVPEIEGAIVALDPHTGRVLAMVGGFDYRDSQFNRATQAERQTGSAFKPFVYAAALDSGFTPSSLVLDAPFVMDQGEGQGKWKPRNSSNTFYGPSTLRLGLEKSRNLMTVRLAQYLGPEKIVMYAEKFGLGKNIRPTLASALGSAETTLIKLTSAYAMIVNGGYEIEPSLIERIQDRRGKTLYRQDTRKCIGCDVPTWNILPAVPDERERILDARTAYQLVSMMEGVIREGTGRRIRSLGIPLGGKTGTTNDAADAWFIGFSPDLVVGVFVGFDQPRSLGQGEEGSSVAVPIFKDFMETALKDQPGIPFRVPGGIRLVRVNADTGLLMQPGDRNVIFEAFIPGTEPTGEQLVLDGQGFLSLDLALKEETSGIY